MDELIVGFLIFNLWISVFLGVNLLSREGNSQTGDRMLSLVKAKVVKL